MKRLLPALIIFLLLYCPYSNAQNLPKRELRAAWVATYFGIDWPNRNHTPQQQRDAFITIVNHHKQTGITTMFVQVRSQCDAMYQSTIEPWGFYLTPAQVNGNAPNPVWDPMQFMIDECHARGIEFHAWINPYRAIGNIANINNFASNHIARQHPEWLIANGVERILDPGIPDVRNHINSVIMDIVNRYDVDGIHFDDFFYPNASFNDDATFALYNRGFTNRADWRRDNINLLIQAVSANIKSLKAWVEFGVSPSGIWRNGGAEGSATTGLQHYVSLYADSRKWLQQAWIDYLCPQVYWYINQPGSDYKVLIPWWNNNAFGRHIYIGMAGYKVNDPAQGPNWANPSQVPNQVRMNRDPLYLNIKGQSIYNTTSLRNNRLGFRDSLRLFFYNKPALNPLMPWIDAVAPQPASNLSTSFAAGAVTLNWTNPALASNEMDKVKQLVIYRSESPVIDLTNANNIVAITPTAVSTFVDNTVQPDKTYYYSITALDRLHNESEAANTAPVCTFTDLKAPDITFCPANAVFCDNGTGSYTIPAVTATDNCVSITYSYAITGATTRNGSGNDASGSFNVGVSTIDWTIMDAAGNTNTCQTTVTVNANPIVTIPDAYALSSGVLPNTVYIGYAPASSLTLTADVITDTTIYFYNWSDGSTGASITVSPLVSTTYSVTVTNARGCEGSASKDIAVLDIRAGKKNDKVVICHESLSLEISGNAVAAHLAHGDMLGTCTEAPVVTTKQSAVSEQAISNLTITALPNPSDRYFTLRLQSGDNVGKLSLRVTDILGRVVEQKENLRAGQLIQIGHSYRRGVYFAEVNDGKEKIVVKLVKQ